jgi:hypothetical protein
MNERLLKFKEPLLTWDANHRNYGLSIDWVELNNIANDLGNPFNIGCRSCLNDLAGFIIAIIKERNI